MKKKNIIYFFILIGILIVCSIIYKNFFCEEKNIPAEVLNDEMVTELYEEAKEIYSWFAIEFPYESLNYEEIKGHYILVDDNRFSTTKELEKYLEHKVTKEIAEYLINQQVKNKIFKEIDGKLYITEYHRWW